MPSAQSLNLATTYFTLGINAFVLLQCLLARTRHQQFLAVFFFASLINYLDDVFWLTAGWQWLPSLNNTYIPFLYLMPAALYLYVVTLINPSTKFVLFSKHWLGFGVAVLFCLPYYWLDSGIKISRLSAPTGSLSPLGLATWGPTTALLLFIPFGLFYITLCLKLLKNNRLRIKAFFSNIEDKTLSWVRYTILILMLAWLVASIELLLPNRITATSYWSIGFAVFELLWLWVFAHFALQQKLIPFITNQEPKQTLSSHNKKYQRSPLDTNEVERIKEALVGATKKQIHRQDDLSLQSLSEQLKISANKISQVLNVHLNTGFYDYINKNRINDACLQLLHSNHNVIDIAYRVGFLSKSTFNKAFKKHAGMTPSQYKKQAL